MSHSDGSHSTVPVGGRDFADIPLNWFCSHIWSGPIEWNIALSLVFPHIGNYQKELTMHDVDICITHMANTMSNPGSSGIFMVGIHHDVRPTPSTLMLHESP